MRTVHDASFERNKGILLFPIGIFTGVVPNLKKTLKSQLIASGNISEKDIPKTVEFLKTCLHLNPWKRPKAGDLIIEEWLEPAFACSCGFSGYH